MEKKLILDVHEKPKVAHWIALSIQHVLAMFGSTVLVPMLTGLPVSLALVSSGIGTLFYLFVTKGKSPVYLGSSFAYIAPITSALALGATLNADGESSKLRSRNGWINDGWASLFSDCFDH